MATTVIVQSGSPGFVVRALWYVFVGWWLTGLAMGLAYVLAVTVVGLPAAFYIFNRIPALLTLRARTKEFVLEPGTAGSVLRERAPARTGGPRYRPARRTRRRRSFHSYAHHAALISVHRIHDVLEGNEDRVPTVRQLELNHPSYSGASVATQLIDRTLELRAFASDETDS